jgi:hypothetical protein
MRWRLLAPGERAGCRRPQTTTGTDQRRTRTPSCVAAVPAHTDKEHDIGLRTERRRAMNRLLAISAQVEARVRAALPLLACLAYGHVRRDGPENGVGPAWWEKYDEVRHKTEPMKLTLEVHCCERCGLVYWEKAR